MVSSSVWHRFISKAESLLHRRPSAVSPPVIAAGHHQPHLWLLIFLNVRTHTTPSILYVDVYRNLGNRSSNKISSWQIFHRKPLLFPAASHCTVGWYTCSRHFVTPFSNSFEPHVHQICRAPNLGSSVHHASVPGSVADTHNSNKIDTKNHTFIAKEKTHYTVRVYIAWATGLISYIRVLRQRSYLNMAPFLQAAWSADVTLDLFFKHIPISKSS